ncbi:MAG: DHA1 family bicyclomycin/chloramphenicol resistance-like MFS transporter [Sulfitobacter sp.]|jgi:DHA1 family bicyclomycin/chloramphenicol resistance-like MFS transporter
MQTSMLRTALILGLICVTGPFAIDMYLPALPAIEAALGTSVSGAQLTLVAYFLAYGVSQLVYGPLSDQIGRKKTLLIGMSIFAVGSVICASAPTIEVLVIGRLIQGMGGATVMVIPRAIIRDMYTGAQATRLMATIMLVISISPMLAPLAGSGIVAVGSWREIFLVMGIFSGVSLTLAQATLPETLKQERRRKVNIKELSRSCGILLRDPVFVGLTFIAGMASFFLFVSSASFVYTGEYGLTPTQFSLAFAFNAVGFFVATQMAGRLAEKWGLATLIGRGVIGFASFATVLALLELAGFQGMWLLLIGLFLAYACLGVVIPSAMVAALDAHGRRAGMASSLSGSMTMMISAACIGLSTPFFDGTALPMVVSIALCGLAAVALVIVTMPKLRQQQMELAVA